MVNDSKAEALEAKGLYRRGCDALAGSHDALC